MFELCLMMYVVLRLFPFEPLRSAIFVGYDPDKYVDSANLAVSNSIDEKSFSGRLLFRSFLNPFDSFLK